MPAVYIPNTIEMAVNATNANGSEEINVLHFYKPSGGVTLTNLQTLGDFFNANVKAAWLAVHTSSYVLHFLRIFGMDNAGSPYLDYSFPANTRGTATGTPLPSGQAIALTLQTPYRGRSNRGRIFFGSLSRDQESNDVITGALSTAILQVGTNMLLAGGTTGMYWGVASRKNHNCIVINSLKLNTDLDSQRRRLPGRGR